MAYQSTNIDNAITAAAGNDPTLRRELHAAFIESVERQADLLRRSRCDGNWEMAALRLKGIAGSFHADGLLALADRALDSAPGDPVAIRGIEDYVRRARTESPV